VDDEPQVRALIVRALNGDGLAVFEAANAPHALVLLEDPNTPPVSLLVTDIVMPGMSGEMLGRLLHARRPALPVLYMSGGPRPTFDFLTAEELERCWLTKPFSVAQLRRKVRALLVDYPTTPRLAS
jgi:DNA-binding response OmpR family regulator